METLRFQGGDTTFVLSLLLALVTAYVARVALKTIVDKDSTIAKVKRMNK